MIHSSSNLYNFRLLLVFLDINLEQPPTVLQSQGLVKLSIALHVFDSAWCIITPILQNILWDLQDAYFHDNNFFDISSKFHYHLMIR